MVDKAVTEKILQQAFYAYQKGSGSEERITELLDVSTPDGPPSFVDGRGYSLREEHTALGDYRCGVEDVIAWLCANSTEISLSLDSFGVEKIVIQRQLPLTGY